jgi:hypothetical protein
VSVLAALKARDRHMRHTRPLSELALRQHGVEAAAGKAGDLDHVCRDGSELQPICWRSCPNRQHNARTMVIIASVLGT